MVVRRARIAYGGVGSAVACRRRARLGLLATTIGVGVAVAWLRDQAPYPYSRHVVLDLELPLLTRRRLDSVLAPAPGQRILEIGPGTGLQSLHVATQLAPGGRLDIVDVQPQMLAHVREQADKRSIVGIVGTCADARKLPFEPATFDAAYLVTVLGEIPHWPLALGQLAAVLRPGGRLVVGEFADRHYVGLRALRREAAAVGLCYYRHTGPPLAYYAVFSKPLSDGHC